MAGERVERRLAAILAADVAGYSRLIGEDEEGTLAALRTIRREVTDPRIAEHRGRIAKTTGDGLLAEFASVVDALRCAAAWQAAMSADSRIAWRIGINVGDIVVEDGDIFGDGVNVAARLEALAEPGGICVSGRVQEDTGGKLDLIFEDQGEQSLKNIARPVRVYRVRPALTLPLLSQRVPPSPASGRGANPMPAQTPLPLAGEGAERQRREAGEGGGAPALALPDKPSIAVLPFANMSGDPEQEYFADGMVEEIITALSRIRWLFVIARNSSFTYKGQAVDVKQVGRELGVRYVLEGSVRKGGNRVRITAQLIDAENGVHLWADRFDGSLEDVFDLQDQVATSVARIIEPKLRQTEIERAQRKPTDNLDSYDLFLRGLAEFHKATQKSYEDAFGLAQQALVRDALYAPAAALAAECRTWQTAQGWIVNTEAIAAEAAQLARQALDSDKDHPDALWMVAHTIGQFTGDIPTAARAVDRAITLNPNAAYAWAIKGWLHLYIDEPEAAIAALTSARRLSPLDPMDYVFTMGVARAHLTAGRYEEAMHWTDLAIAESPTLVIALRIKVVLYQLMGVPSEAQEWLRRLRAAAPGMTIENFVAYAAHHYTPALRALFVDALRAVGLPDR